MKKFVTFVFTLITASLIIIAVSAGADDGQYGYGIHFEEVTHASGIEYTGSSFGVSWGDANNDSWPDIWTGNHGRFAGEPSLYLNQGNETFSNYTNSVEFFTDDFHGAEWADFDNDGDQDLFMLVGAASGKGKGPNQFFINSGGFLQEQALQYGLDYPLGRGRTPLWFDWNNDGKLDVFLSNVKRSDGAAPSALFSQGDGFFRDSLDETWLETSNNLFAQLITLGIEYSPTLVTSGSPFPDRVYDYCVKPFEDLQATIGLFPAPIWAVSDSAIADFNGDLLPDMFIARTGSGSEAIQSGPAEVEASIVVNVGEKGFSFHHGNDLQVQIDPIFWVKPADIFIGSNGIHPTSIDFTLSATDPAVVGMPAHSPGVDSGVYIGYDPAADQWKFLLSYSYWMNLNLVVTASEPITSLATVGFVNSDGALPDKLFIQNKNSGFSDLSAAAGLTLPTSCPGVTAADFDNDMDVDLYLVCSGPTGNRPNILYENLGNGTFQLVPNAGGAAGSTEGRGEAVAAADFDNDGFMDLFVTNGFGAEPFYDGPSQLIRNLGNGNHWLEIDLEGVISNRDGIGALIFASAGGVTQFRQCNGGMHRFSQDHKRIHFGLANNTVLDTLTVYWPSGIVQEIKNLPADQVVHILEQSGPGIAGKPSYQPGREDGVYLWKDSFDGPYHLEVSGDGPHSIFTIELIADKPLENVTPRLLEGGDSLTWDENHLAFKSQVTTWIDGVDFQLSPGAKAMISLEKNGEPNPRQLHVGASGDPLAPAGWIIDETELPDTPNFQGGQDLGIFLGRDPASGKARLRWNGDGYVHRAKVDLIFSDLPYSITPVGFEQNDRITAMGNSMLIDSIVSVWWDGLDIHMQPGTQIGLAYTQDGLVQPNRVNPESRDLGFPNAYRLPQAEPYGKPVYDPAEEANLFLWKDESSGIWHLRGTAGGGQRRYFGVIVCDLPFVRLTPYALEATDILDNSEPARIIFDLRMCGPWEDGFDFQLPESAVAHLTLVPQRSQKPAEAVRIGSERWSVENLPVNISGW